MARLAYALLVGLVGAAVVHIAVLLLVPAYSGHDAWARLAERSDAFTTTMIAAGEDDDPFRKGADPLFASAACRFALTTGIARFQASGDVPFWSVSVYDRRGQSIYSFNDRTATERKLDLVIATPVQMVELRKDLPEEYAASIFVETEAREGIVVARIFVPDDSWKELASEYLKGAICRQE